MNTGIRVPTKVHRNKRKRKEWLGFGMKPDLIKSIRLATDTTLNADWYVNVCLLEVFDFILKRKYNIASSIDYK